MPSDINLSQFIFRKAPPSWHPYIKLIRLDRPIGIWLLLFPCWWSILMSGDISLTTVKFLLLFAIGAILMRSAGCIVNDLWDRNLDASVARTSARPLASGEITVPQALRFLTALLFLSLLVLLMLPHVAIVLGILSLGLVAAYPLMKRVTWVPQLFLGFTFNWGALMGAAAVTGHLTKAGFLLYISGIFWTLGYDTIYAHQDKEDDMRIGIKSTARLFGDKSKLYVSIFYALAVLFLLLAKNSSTPAPLTPLLCIPAAGQLVWQIRNWDINDPQSCLKTFKSNQIYGWLALLMLAV
jgi:4-hydroxybenzoate polyprenyltransferase